MEYKKNSEKMSGKKITRERWNLLKNAIVNKSQDENSSSSSSSNSNSGSGNSVASNRRFTSYGLIKFVKFAYKETAAATTTTTRSSRDHSDGDESNGDGGGESDEPFSNWYSVQIPRLKLKSDLYIRIYEYHTSINDLAGFNNTGNVCLWPSEEAMAYFCAKNSALFENKSVCELGGGMTCLAGLMVCCYSSASEVFLTDGNEACFKNLETICSKNEFDCVVECCLLRWNKEKYYEDLEKRFDYIICADCLFFDESREHLCATIYKLLKKDGICFIFAPNRKNTFHKFVDYAKSYFECVIVNNYDEDVWSKHIREKENNESYDQDVDYPLLLQLKKREVNNNKTDYCKMLF